MGYLAVSATFFALVALASTSPLAADCGAGADEANAKCYPTLQAAVDAALAGDLPLVLPRGTYRIKAPLVIDYSHHAGTGFELIARGATIDGTAVGGPALIIECATDCFYFHQEGTLFVNADTDGAAVVFGKADFSDPHNSGKLDHLIVNNRSTGQHATGCQFNYVLNWDVNAVCVSAGGGAGMDLEQVQFSTFAAPPRQSRERRSRSARVISLPTLSKVSTSKPLRYASPTCRRARRTTPGPLFISTAQPVSSTRATPRHSGRFAGNWAQTCRSPISSARSIKPRARSGAIWLWPINESPAKLSEPIRARAVELQP